MALLLACFLSCGSLLLLAGLVRGHPEGAVRLSGGFQQKSGLVEVLINGSWIPIAQENWTRENAEVVCRQLGYTEVASLLGADDLCPIPEKTEFVVGGVNCSGKENTITECMWTVLDAKGLNKFPIGVTCADDEDIRLVNKTRIGTGSVEMLQDGAWVTLKNSTMSFKPRDLCRELGFDEGSQLPGPVTNNTDFIESSGSGEQIELENDFAVMLECSGPPPPPCMPLLSSLSCDSISITTHLLSSFTNNTSYRIRYRQVNNTSQNLPWTITAFFSLNQTNLPVMATIDQLCPAILYEVQAQSLNSYGPSGWSASLLVRNNLLELPTPHTISITDISFSSANISWTIDQMLCGSSFVTGFEILLSSHQDDDSSVTQLYQLNQQLPAATNATSSLLLSDLQPSVTYSIQVRSLSNDAGSDCDISSTISSFSSSTNFTTPLPDLLLNSSLRTILMNEPGRIQLTATWQLASQESDDCDTLVDFVTLRCRGDDDDVVEGRSQCDGVMSDGDVSVIARELSQYECNVTAFSTNGVMLATNTIDVSTPQSVPGDFKVVNTSHTSLLLKWNYSTIASPILGFRLSIFALDTTQSSRQEILLNSSTLSEGSTYSHLIGQLIPGRMYEIDLAVTTSFGVGPNTTLRTRTPERAPSFPPTQLTISTNSSTVTFTWTPPTNDADDNSIGYIVHCGSSTTALSYVLLSLSSRNYTLAFSREDARHYGNLTCHVTRFNSAGESGASNRVQIQFEIDSTVTTTTDTVPTAFLSNPTISLAFLVILLILMVVILLIIVITLLGCARYRHRQHISNSRRRMGRISQAQPGRPSDDIYNVYQVGEPIEQSYIPMAATSSLLSRNNHRTSLWIDSPETPSTSSFMPIIENPVAITTHQRTGSDAASVGREIDASDRGAEEKKEEDDYDEVTAQMVTEIKAKMKTVEVTDDENLYDEIIPKSTVLKLEQATGVEVGEGGAESSQASNIIPPPTEFAVLPRRTSLPTTIYTQARRPPPRRPTVGARPSQVTLVIPSNNQVTVNKNTENGSKEVDQEVSHYSIPSNRPLLSDPNVSPQYEVVFNPDHLALLLKNDAAIEQEKEEKTSVATES